MTTGNKFSCALVTWRATRHEIVDTKTEQLTFTHMLCVNTLHALTAATWQRMEFLRLSRHPLNCTSAVGRSKNIILKLQQKYLG
jgi:hypothetical protein